MKRLSPEEAKARLRARDAAKKRRKNAKRRAEREAARAASQHPQISKTSVFYRRMLPPLPKMSKRELRAMLTAAVVNTQGLQP